MAEVQKLPPFSSASKKMRLLLGLGLLLLQLSWVARAHDSEEEEEHGPHSERHRCIFDHLHSTLHPNSSAAAHRYLQTVTPQDYAIRSDRKGRILQSTTYSPIRLIVDTSRLDVNG